MSVYNTQCCGIDEYINMYRYKNVKEFLINNIDEQTDDWSNNETDFSLITPFVLFSDVKENNLNKVTGEKVYKYITKNKLGEVFKSKSRVNYNSDNHLTAYLWTINRVNLKAWYNKNK